MSEFTGRFEHYVAGRFVPAEGAIEVLNPATERAIGATAEAGADLSAVAAAAEQLYDRPYEDKKKVRVSEEMRFTGQPLGTKRSSRAMTTSRAALARSDRRERMPR